jgi:N-acetyl-gamma-glutamyl-phosphate reductase
MELQGDFRAYKALTHQHTPEIAQTLKVGSLVFIPHLLPIARGILCTTVATLTKDPGAVLKDAYMHEPFVKLMPTAESVRIKDAANTPHCLVGATVQGDRVVVISAIDNLLKGAASQAVQNLNLMLGAPETEGLL